VSHDKSAMKIGVDGALLGAWADAKGINILDVGTGCGLLALMLAQKNSNAFVLGIDIDSAATDEAQENFKNSQWASRMKSQNCNLLGLDMGNCFDNIICNPPFFEGGVKANSEQRHLARNTESLSPENLAQQVKKLLTDKGIFSVIYPVKIAVDFVKMAEEQGLYLNRYVEVFPVVEKTAHRWLMEFSNKKKEVEERQLYIRTNDGSYSEEYKKMCSDFYLAF
jgi:tRNA1Val (adenine37-N6)-methyltransferase